MTKYISDDGILEIIKLSENISKDDKINVTIKKNHYPYNKTYTLHKFRCKKLNYGKWLLQYTEGNIAELILSKNVYDLDNVGTTIVNFYEAYNGELILSWQGKILKV